MIVRHGDRRLDRAADRTAGRADRERSVGVLMFFLGPVRRVESAAGHVARVVDEGLCARRRRNPRLHVDHVEQRERAEQRVVRGRRFVLARAEVERDDGGLRPEPGANRGHQRQEPGRRHRDDIRRGPALDGLIGDGGEVGELARACVHTRRLRRVPGARTPGGAQHDHERCDRARPGRDADPRTVRASRRLYRGRGALRQDVGGGSDIRTPPTPVPVRSAVRTASSVSRWIVRWCT